MREAIPDQILTAAGALFYTEGIRAVGIDRIIEEAKVAKLLSIGIFRPRIILSRPIFRIATIVSFAR